MTRANHIEKARELIYNWISSDKRADISMMGRDALEAAIAQALADERRQALGEAYKALLSMEARLTVMGYYQQYFDGVDDAAKAIRALAEEGAHDQKS